MLPSLEYCVAILIKGKGFHQIYLRMAPGFVERSTIGVEQSLVQQVSLPSLMRLIATINQINRPRFRNTVPCSEFLIWTWKAGF